ncbi:hypothetical protein HUT19_41215 [Streptomyces sp. NA02950]|uniref:hypothetical protein n=1 Tax=Streptomyces sp. NA02950 TaxID=2742137 RepID=UPI00159270AE|nr:hypothetical protein [Streptomyces sp. NA02950]QKV90365.1 hypothetical protein HUT19_00005 [Streptomyces sp. NA02950]QKV97302.1 hypothetical protein HUT19_41215 [Streptomyces sp. NA02950]
MPNFTAYAAHEALAFAQLTPSTDRLDNLHRHMTALEPDVPPNMRLLMLTVASALAAASEATAKAGSLSGRDRTRAYAEARELTELALRDAEELILAIEPTAARFRGIDMPVTPETITAATLAYAKVTASTEEVEAIRRGTPVVRVWCSSDKQQGKRITARISAGVHTDSGWQDAHPPILYHFWRVDGRRDAAANARQRLWRRNPARRYLAVTDVDVEFCNDPRV